MPYVCWWANPLRLLVGDSLRVVGGGFPYGVGGGIPYGVGGGISSVSWPKLLVARASQPAGTTRNRYNAKYQCVLIIAFQKMHSPRSNLLRQVQQQQITVSWWHGGLGKARLQQ